MIEQPPQPADIGTDTETRPAKRRAKPRRKAAGKTAARPTAKTAANPGGKTHVPGGKTHVPGGKTHVPGGKTHVPGGKTHVIVTGVARSGTTALAKLLNAHEGICLGVERFKFQFLRQNNHSAALFERDRFFTFLEEDTNIRPDSKPEWQPLYEDIARKWDSARVIGDKVPDMMPVLPAFLQTNPDFKCIYILRSLKAVALSWQTRADDRRDSWPSGRGFELACESWAAQARDMEQLMASGRVKGRILLLDYDKMCEPGNRSAEAILRFLDLPASAAFSATYQEHVDFFQSRGPARSRLPEPFKAVYANTDKTDFQALRSRARRHVVRLSGKPGKVLTA